MCYTRLRQTKENQNQRSIFEELLPFIDTLSDFLSRLGF
jgi:hypothetical protein